MSNHRKFLVLPALAVSLTILACGAGESTPTPGIVMTASLWTPSPEATFPSAGASDEDCSNDYFPTDEGSKWTYSTESEGGGAQERTATIVSTTENGFSVELGLASGARFVIQWSCSGGDLTQLTPTATLYVAGDSAGVTADYHFGVTLPADLDSAPSWQESGEWSAGDAGTRFRGSYSFDNIALGTEIIAVPGGTFEAMRVESKAEGTLNGDPTPPCQITQWWAKDVGLVRQVTTCPVGGQDMTEVVELLSYESP